MHQLQFLPQLTHMSAELLEWKLVAPFQAIGVWSSMKQLASAIHTEFPLSMRQATGLAVLRGCENCISAFASGLWSVAPSNPMFTVNGYFE